MKFLQITTWLCLAAVLFIAPRASSGQDADEENKSLGTIVKISFSGLNAIKEDVAADVATLNVGDTLTRSKLENSINDLRKWGVFESVEVLVEYDDQDITLVYELKEGYIIKEITIRGNYPLLQSKVQRVLFLNRGAIYDHSKLPEQVDRLDRLYEQEGYFGTTVLAIEDYDQKNREVSLFFRIKKGDTYKLDDVDIQGNKDLNIRRIRTIIFTYSHYKPKTIKRDLQKITDLYKKKGFVRARVRLEGENYDYDLKEVDIDVLIRQGPQVKVEFEGNDHFFDRTLRKQITVFEGGDFDEFELDASKQKLINFYQRRGYENVAVEWTREFIKPEPEAETEKGKEVKKPPRSPIWNKWVELRREVYGPPEPPPSDAKEPATKRYRVTFKIQEGPRRQVKDIEFSGNENIKSKKLLKLMATKKSGFGEKGYYLEPLFEEDLRNIEKFYQAEGYPDAEIASWEKLYSRHGDGVTLQVHINEGDLARVQEVKLEGVPDEMQKEIFPTLLLQNGKPYSEYLLSQDIQSILVYLSDEGYPYAQIVHDVQEVAPHRYNVTFQTTTGPQVRIGRLLFVGNTLTRESIIRQNLRIKEGDLFSTTNILQSQINLRGLGVFDAVNLETLGLTSQRKVVNLVVRVQEKKPKIIDVEAGYSTDLGFSGKLTFNKLNMWGSGKNGNIQAQVGNQVNQLEINYIDPRVYGTGLQLVLGVFGGREDRPFFESTRVGGFGNLSKSFGPSLTAYGRLGFGFADNNDRDTVFESINPNPDPNQSTRLQTSLGTTYDTRDNFGNPRRGTYLNGTVSLTNEFIQRSGNYFTLRSNMGYWYSPFSRFTIANALRVAQIISVPGDTIVPTDARLYLGGDSTVRGFDEDSLLPSGGKFSLVWNLEFQMRVFGNFQLVGFTDTGVVTDSITQVSLGTLRHSAGPGFRYMTPVGPIRLDYGFVLDPQNSDPTDHRLHFSFGYFF